LTLEKLSTLHQLNLIRDKPLVVGQDQISSDFFSTLVVDFITAKICCFKVVGLMGSVDIKYPTVVGDNHNSDNEYERKSNYVGDLQME